MVKPNWDIFRAKFSQNPQNYFEWFCYLLFCDEHKAKIGIFRYKNQASIETNPIEHDNNTIGWQAKFYDTPLANHTDEIIATLEKSKQYYPSISKLIFYSNQDWGQNKGKDPKGLIAANLKAKNLGIALDWRLTSFFESEFVAIKSNLISQHFFELGSSIFSLIEQQQSHAITMLNQIHTSFNFKGVVFEIDRSKEIDLLLSDGAQTVILSGDGGIGKTAIIKKLYEQIGSNFQVYVFKATEFELRTIDGLFNNFRFSDFIQAHQSFGSKIIVIDSAEKLLDLDNQDPFKEFISVIIKEGWRIIFTTRRIYLEDLNTQFLEIHGILPRNIPIPDMELTELANFSEQYGFSLPKDDKLQELIRRPFYLNEYLKISSDIENWDYSKFKSQLWTKIIKKAKPERERAFLQLALDRANTGQFYNSSPDNAIILQDELLKDGLVGYETPGYFITHDIYEEWALEKSIEGKFTTKSSILDFFSNLGSSLPIRRSFRSWLSEKLLLDNPDSKSFVTETVIDPEINAIWRDEILVSVLLSNYSHSFFDSARNELLANDCKLLRRLSFILQIACKEVDDERLRQLGHKPLNLSTLRVFLTKPKGKGWENFIKFVFTNINEIGLRNFPFILPIIHDWNKATKIGEATRFSGLIAMQYYEWSMTEKDYYIRDEGEKELLQTILNAANEIKDELEAIYETIITEKAIEHGDKYVALCKMILTELDGIPAAMASPKHIIRLANLFWSPIAKSRKSYFGNPREIEESFGLSPSFREYFPASAYQTPIYCLLKANLKDTLDFIINITNRCVRAYANSRFDPSVREIALFPKQPNERKQYISHCLWCMYRGTGSPVSPYLLQSIHMALEKYLLEAAMHSKGKGLEGCLLYLLNNSNSASITSVVASVVLANPENLFNIAHILFQTKEFFELDSQRLLAEGRTKLLYGMGPKFGGINDFYDDERIKTCDDTHRNSGLEQLFLKYQYFKVGETTDAEADRRKEILWSLLDDYYQELAERNSETESDKHWRLCLARMDRRRITVTSETTKEGVILKFESEIDPELKEYSEEAIKRTSEPLQHMALRRWAELKFRHDNEFKKIAQYEENPLAALKEARDIHTRLFKSTKEVSNSTYILEGDAYQLFNSSIPSYVCSVLIENHLDILSQDDKNFCREVILWYSSRVYNPDYRYDISDGLHPAIACLPTLLATFPDDTKAIKTILLFALFIDDTFGIWAHENFNVIPTLAIGKLWQDKFEDAKSFVSGYILLKPLFDEFRRDLFSGVFGDHRNGPKIYHVTNIFIKTNEALFVKFHQNELKLEDLPKIDTLSARVLKTALQIFPQTYENEDLKTIAKLIISTISAKIRIKSERHEVDYMVKHDFFEIYARFVLSAPQNDIADYLKPFLDSFDKSELNAEVLKAFVYAEDQMNKYENFWSVWRLFKEKIVDVCKDGDSQWHVAKIVRSYLFAEAMWRENVREWHSLKAEDTHFLREMAEQIGHCPSALFAISKLLYDIGSNYAEEGLGWISNIFRKNQNYVKFKLEDNTVYYLETVCRIYIYGNLTKVRRTKLLRDNLLTTLDFLIEKGSAIGYMLRERIA